jgi:hypothetical protein
MATQASHRKTILRTRIVQGKPSRFRKTQLDALEQIATATIVDDAVFLHSRRIEGLVYAVTRKGCQCPGYCQHEHCYHQGLRKVVLWLLEWLPREGLTLAKAVANLRKAKERGGCGAVDCSFCRTLHRYGCPRMAAAADYQAVQATAA